MNLTPLEKIIRARMKLMDWSPFYSYLSLLLNIKEDKGELGGHKTMGVDIYGNLYYNDDFVNELSEDHLMAVLAHEINHVAFSHCARRKERNRLAWNIACDLVVNSLLIRNKFSLPKDCLIPKTDEFEICGKIINKISTKTAEEIYSELPTSLIAKTKIDVFDVHIEIEGELSETERDQLREEWTKRLEEAKIYAEQRGIEPLGFDRFIKGLREPTVNWRTLLNRYIRSSIPADFNWLKRSKKSIASKYYFPGIKKQSLDVVVALDLSGSITDERFAEFISEIVSIAKSYRNSAKIRVLSHDFVVHSDLEVNNANESKIRDMRLKGGGGTSHMDVFNYIKKNISKTKLAIFFTDGYSDLQNINFEDYDFEKIIVLTPRGIDSLLANKRCKIVRIGNDD